MEREELKIKEREVKCWKLCCGALWKKYHQDRGSIIGMWESDKITKFHLDCKKSLKSNCEEKCLYIG